MYRPCYSPTVSREPFCYSFQRVPLRRWRPRGGPLGGVDQTQGLGRKPMGIARARLPRLGQSLCSQGNGDAMSRANHGAEKKETHTLFRAICQPRDAATECTCLEDEKQRSLKRCPVFRRLTRSILYGTCRCTI